MSWPGSTTMVRYRAGAAPTRCIVFLHGFGGLMTAYVDAIARSELGREALVLAPVLDPMGVWASDRGAGVVEDALAHASSLGFSRCWLVGLSNGAIGAWQLPGRPEIASHLWGAVLLSGIPDTSLDARLPALPTLAVSGWQDARFDWSWVDKQATAAEKRVGPDRMRHFGLAADHFLILSADDAWTATALRFAREVEGRK